jgi:hypothetical protein
MERADRQSVMNGIRLHLIENDPSQITRNKFPLRRLSPHAEYELRLDNWRVFYTVMEDDTLVVVNLIGVKQNNTLLIDGEEFEL